MEPHALLIAVVVGLLQHGQLLLTCGPFSRNNLQATSNKMMNKTPDS